MMQWLFWLARHHSSLVAPNCGPQTVRIMSLVDYKVWDAMQERVYHMPIHDIDDLKQQLIDTWSRIHHTAVSYG